jgi:hypothetical protein
MYQVGQAVINGFDNLGFIQKLYTHAAQMQNLKGEDYVMPVSSIKRPATVDEILAEIQKHGWWYHTIDMVIQSKYFHLIKYDSGTWDWFNRGMNGEKLNLKKYCEEGLIIDRIITALNLAK